MRAAPIGKLVWLASAPVIAAVLTALWIPAGASALAPYVVRPVSLVSGSTSTVPAADIAAAPDGTLLVLRGGAVVRLAASGRLLATYGISATRLAVAPDGTFWTIDQGRNVAVKWSADGRELIRLGRNGGDGSVGDGPTEFREPSALAVRSDGRVLIADAAGAKEFGSGGQFLRRFGSALPDVESIRATEALSDVTGGGVYVAGRFSVVAWAESGTSARTLLGLGDRTQNTPGPQALAALPDRSVWVADPAERVLVRVAPSGSVRTSCGSASNPVELAKLTVDRATGALFAVDGRTLYQIARGQSSGTVCRDDPDRPGISGVRVAHRSSSGGLLTVKFRVRLRRAARVRVTLLRIEPTSARLRSVRFASAAGRTTARAFRTRAARGRNRYRVMITATEPDGTVSRVRRAFRVAR